MYIYIYKLRRGPLKAKTGPKSLCVCVCLCVHLSITDKLWRDSAPRGQLTWAQQADKARHRLSRAPRMFALLPRPETKGWLSGTERSEQEILLSSVIVSSSFLDYRGTVNWKRLCTAPPQPFQSPADRCCETRLYPACYLGYFLKCATSLNLNLAQFMNFQTTF